MEKTVQKFEKGDLIFVINVSNCYVYEYPANIKSIDENAHTFSVEFVDSFQSSALYTYSFKDLGYLFFDTEEEAEKFVAKMPMYHQIMYRVIGSRVYERVIENIFAKHIDGVYNVFFVFNKGKYLTIRELCHTLLFSKEENARDYVATMKKNN